MKVRGVDDALATTGGLGMNRHLLPSVVDTDATVRHHHPHAVADEPPRHAVAVGIDLDRAIGLDAADELTHLPKGRSARERLERRSLIVLKAAHPHVTADCIRLT